MHTAIIDSPDTFHTTRVHSFFLLPSAFFLHFTSIIFTTPAFPSTCRRAM